MASEVMGKSRTKGEIEKRASCKRVIFIAFPVRFITMILFFFNFSFGNNCKLSKNHKNRHSTRLARIPSLYSPAWGQERVFLGWGHSLSEGRCPEKRFCFLLPLPCRLRLGWNVT